MRIAFLGLGIMGSRMAANLVGAGHELTVWNRTASRAEAFAGEHGGRVAATPAAAAESAELVISMVVDGPQVEAVLLGQDGAASGAAGREGVVCVDCSTIGPTWARRVGRALRDRGLALVDAPVTGSAPRAEDGTLTIMVGGGDEAVARARPALEAMGRLIVPCGALGQGQMVKLLNNAVAAVNAMTVAQALVLGAAAGVDLGAAQQVMAAGSGGSAMLDLKGEPMRHHDFAPLFKLDHMLKDVELCLAEAGERGAPFGLADLARDALAQASAAGLGEQDFAALLTSVEAAAGVTLTDGPAGR
jgi:3-hydroxyisobutyrate dehydrogenase-like beta-hydroxyacid dehydrogenase